jgi:site-specific recombinase XerD
MSRMTIKQSRHLKLSELIDYYEVCNKSEGKSPKTVSWYSANLRQFDSYVKSRHLSDSVDSVDIKLLRQYVLHLLNKVKRNGQSCPSARGGLLSAATVHGHVRTLKVFFSWLAREEIIDTNPAQGLKPPKVTKKIVPTLSDEEIREILNTFNIRDPIDVRNQTIFMVLLDTGLRIGELINLKIGDVNLDSGILKVLGKGRKERVVPLGNKAQRAVHKYLFRFRTEPANGTIDNVFLSIHGAPLSENSMKLMFARLAQRSGVKRLHAHLCRHTFATKFLVNGGDVFTLQQILGHSTLEMVRHYASLASSHVVMQHQRYSPLDRLSVGKV